MPIIRSHRSGLYTLVGFHRLPGCSWSRSVASWGHQYPSLEGGSHLSRPYSFSFSNPVSLPTLPGPKGRCGHRPAGVLRLRSSLWVPSHEDRRVFTLIWIDQTGLLRFVECVTDDFLISRFEHHQRLLLVKNVLKAWWGVTMRSAWKNGWYVMAQMTVGTEQMNRAVVNDMNMTDDKIQIYI